MTSRGPLGQAKPFGETTVFAVGCGHMKQTFRCKNCLGGGVPGQTKGFLLGMVCFQAQTITYTKPAWSKDSNESLLRNKRFFQRLLFSETSPFWLQKPFKFFHSIFWEIHHSSTVLSPLDCQKTRRLKKCELPCVKFSGGFGRLKKHLRLRPKLSVFRSSPNHT